MESKRNNKRFLIIGRSATGKSTITKLAAKQLNMKVLKSYTDRPMRKNETPETADHTFVSKEEADQMLKNYTIIAYTDAIGDGYRRFATLEQLNYATFYVIDPYGISTLQTDKYKDFEFIEVYITAPDKNAVRNANKRGHNTSDHLARRIEEDKQFTQYEENKTYKYLIENNGTLEEAVEKLVNIVYEECY